MFLDRIFLFIFILSSCSSEDKNLLHISRTNVENISRRYDTIPVSTLRYRLTKITRLRDPAETQDFVFPT